MSLWTKAALGVAVAAVCAGGAAAQVPEAVVPPPGPVVPAHGAMAPTPGCATCKGGPLKPGVPNTIPHCSKHNGLTQYPLSEKRYIKQFCNPTICPNSCFGHFKTQWTAWPTACPGWPAEGVDPANYGPNFTRHEPPAAAAPGTAAPAPQTPPAAAPTAPEPKPADLGTPPPAPPSKPLEVPPSKPATTTPPSTPLPMPQVPAPGGVKLPDLPPASTPPGGRF